MYIADLHIHSRYSRATSKECTPEHLDLWARRKGIHLLGTGDFTHPAWRKELEEKLNNREMILASKEDSDFIPITQDVTDDFTQEAITPIICEGDMIGGVVLIDNGEKGKMGEVEQKLIQSAAGFLGRQMEQ